MTRLTDEAKAIADQVAADSHPNLAAALVAALADLKVVETAKTAKIEMKSGGNFTYQYADIADVVKLTRPVLAGHGLVALTPVHDHGDGLACTVILLHTSGERLDLGPLPFPHGRDAQATGSMITYHRRYALVAALGMAAGDDDDGASAAPRSSERASEPATKGNAPTCARCGESLAGAKVKSGDGGFVHATGCKIDGAVSPATAAEAPVPSTDEPQESLL